MKNLGLQMKYFVLRPGGTDDFAHASRVAMRAFAREIEETNPDLAVDIQEWADYGKEYGPKEQSKRLLNRLMSGETETNLDIDGE